MEINIGIDEKDRKEIVQGLSRLLADTYTLYLKTHSFHWNVTGPMFNTLHLMFETQYNELWLAVDLVAERIRALGAPAPGSYTDFAKLTAIRESNESHGHIGAMEMIKQLLEGHETVARTARSVFPAAEKGNDEASLDMMTSRITVHEKTAWMLRSLLQG
jgi:starvation-inducible DNA-binding protein